MNFGWKFYWIHRYWEIAPQRRDIERQTGEVRNLAYHIKKKTLNKNLIGPQAECGPNNCPDTTDDVIA